MKSVWIDNRIKVGDKVIRKDGLVGRVIESDEKYGDFVVKYENNVIEKFPKDGKDGEICCNLCDFYLIGRTVLGNKIDEETLQRQLDEQYDIVKQEQAKYKQLRKQLWYLKNRMLDK